MVPVEDLVRAGRVQELRGIGPGIAARLEELVSTGRIAELDELEREVRPELVGLVDTSASGPRRMLELAAELGRAHGGRVPRRPHFWDRLRSLPRDRAGHRARILERLEQSGSRPRRGLLLHERATCSRQIAQALGGEIAGDARRWVDEPRLS